MTWMLFIVINVAVAAAAGPATYADKATCLTAAQTIASANSSASGAYICFQQTESRAQIAQEGAVSFGPQSDNAAMATKNMVLREAQSTAAN